MDNEFDDKEFELELAQKNHKELTTSLGKLTTAISEDKGDKEIAKAITEQANKIDGLAKAISSIPKPEKQQTPEVKIEYNHEKLVSLLNGFTDNIKESNQKVIEALENRLLPDTFELVKGYGGETQSVKVKYKSAKEINSKK